MEKGIRVIRAIRETQGYKDKKAIKVIREIPAQEVSKGPREIRVIRAMRFGRNRGAIFPTVMGVSGLGRPRQPLSWRLAGG